MAKEYGWCEICLKPGLVRVTKQTARTFYGICSKCEQEQDEKN